MFMKKYFKINNKINELYFIILKLHNHYSDFLYALLYKIRL
jgi:hypothetical protein